MIFQAASREGSDIKEGGTNAGCAWCSCSSGDSYFTNWLASWVKGHLRKSTSHSNWKFARKELTMYFASHFNFYCWFYWSLQGDNSCLDVCGCTTNTTSWGVHGWNCHHCCEAGCRVGFYIAFSEIMKNVFGLMLVHLIPTGSWHRTGVSLCKKLFDICCQLNSSWWGWWKRFRKCNSVLEIEWVNCLQLFCSGESRMSESGNQERTAEFPNASRGRYQQIPTRVGMLSSHMLL